MKAYKGFDENFECRGFKYKVGETYRIEGEVKLCENGFHACENPFDVWQYYPPEAISRFGIVTLGGGIVRGHRKLAASTITVEAEISLSEFIAAGNEYLGRKSFTQYGVKSAVSKDGGTLATSEFNGHLAALGCRSRVIATGSRSHLIASGGDSSLSALGGGSHLAASGERTYLTAREDGNYLVATGEGSRIAASGRGNVCIGAARNCRAKVGKNGVIALAYHDGTQHRIAVGYEGEDGIEADTWYCVGEDGKFRADE